MNWNLRRANEWMHNPFPEQETETSVKLLCTHLFTSYEKYRTYLKLGIMPNRFFSWNKVNAPSYQNNKAPLKKKFTKFSLISFGSYGYYALFFQDWRTVQYSNIYFQGRLELHIAPKNALFWSQRSSSSGQFKLSYHIHETEISLDNGRSSLSSL